MCFRELRSRYQRKAIMRKISFAKSICAVSLAAVCACGLAACSGNSTGSDSESTGLTGGVAATVNGVNIDEDTVTEAIESARTNYINMYYYYLGTDVTEDKTDDEVWADYLDTYGYTPEELRDEYLNKYIDDELLLQYADQLGVNIDDETIDAEVEKMRSNYDSEEEWKNALDRLGITENDYKDEIKLELTYDEAYATFAEGSDEADDEAEELGIDETVDDSDNASTIEAEESSSSASSSSSSSASSSESSSSSTSDSSSSSSASDSSSSSSASSSATDDESDDAAEDEADEVTDEELLEYAQENAKDLYDGAKRSSHVLFDAEDEDQAEEVLNQINRGRLGIAAAAEEYSIDTASASEGGDVGWDKVTSFVDEYQDALDELSKGQVSDLVESDYGIHIIECTDVFNVPDEITSISSWPDEIVEDMKDKIVEEKEEAAEQAQEDAYNAWLDECREKADIVINDMPENVPYNVDLSANAEDEATDETEGDADSTDDEGDSADKDNNTDADNEDTDSSSSSSANDSSSSSSANTASSTGSADDSEESSSSSSGSSSGSSASSN